MNHIDPSRDAGLSPRVRIALAAMSGVLLLLLMVAARLEPDNRGYGTHTQLGMGDCFVLDQWGVRCPSCGMTTAWARLLDGHFKGAVAANAGGTLLCVLAMAALPWLLASLLRGRWWYLRPTAGLVLPSLAVVVLVVLIDWTRHTGLALLAEWIP